MARVTIGVPVRNGAALLGEALACLERQTYRDMRIVVRDNASTDDSLAIAQAFAARDSRFTVIAGTEPVEAVENFRLVLAAADTPFFAWRAYDDVSSDDYVARLVAALEATPAAGLAAGDVETWKAHRGRRRLHRVPRLSGSSPVAIVQLMRAAQASWYYGLWRRSVIDDLFAMTRSRYGHLWANDHVTLFPLILRRAIAFAPGATFVQRLGADPSRPRSAYTPAPEQELQIATALWRVCRALVAEAPLSRPATIAALAALPYYVHRRAFRLTRIGRAWLTQRPSTPN